MLHIGAHTELSWGRPNFFVKEIFVTLEKIFVASKKKFLYQRKFWLYWRRFLLYWRKFLWYRRKFQLYWINILILQTFCHFKHIFGHILENLIFLSANGGGHGPLASPLCAPVMLQMYGSYAYDRLILIIISSIL